MNNFPYVNNTGYNLKDYHNILMEVYRTRKLPEDFEDIFKITFIYGLNDDGSYRMIVEMA